MEEKKIRYTFCKEEKLKKKKRIAFLFEKGKSFHQFPIRWVYLAATEKDVSDFPIQVGFSVSKKKFKSAVKRNRIKRLMREAWRLNKHHLYKNIPENTSYFVMLIYTSKEEMSFDELEKKMKKSMKRFLEKKNKAK